MTVTIITKAQTLRVDNHWPVILTLGLTIYGVAAFGQETKTTSSSNENDLQTKQAWDQFKGGFFVGACGSAGFAFICLSSIPTFTAS